MGLLPVESLELHLLVSDARWLPKLFSQLIEGLNLRLHDLFLICERFQTILSGGFYEEILAGLGAGAEFDRFIIGREEFT